MVRRAFTLAELVVALTLGGVTFGAFALVVAQQERLHARLAHRIRARGQAAEGIAPLLVDLRSLSPSADDVAPGEARDSSIELRATVATFAVCELHDRTIVTALGSFLSAPRTGDSAWIFAGGDSTEWFPLAITNAVALATVDSAVCGTAANAAGAIPERNRLRYALALAEPPTVPIPPGTPVQLKRRTRYSLYRAPDGRWYLGRREYSSTLGRFETTQPVSGPYRSYAPVGEGSSGLELRYFDRHGSEVASGDHSTHRIATIAITTRTPPPAGGSVHDRRDVMSITLAPRNVER